ncbi:Hint domain-containing protein, partial [Salipiger sp. 1_MG-2023]|uniref:Hint domain-containing protein n=1 Tax=Salipiger sp. 1_MG-2023 TaxID=3062665 RepID=UPI0026E470EB
EEIDGGAGYDRIIATSGDDTLDFSGYTMTGVERIEGGDGDDSMIGSAGADVLDGGDGIDTLQGGAGDDTLYGETGNDSLDGGDHSDTFVVENSFGADTVTGGEGGVDYDTIHLNAVSYSVTATYTADSAGFITDGTNTVTFTETEHLVLTNYADLVDASADSIGADIDAMGGADSVLGGAGGDTVDGGEGSDTIHGGLGQDSLTGGGGDDTVLGQDDGDNIQMRGGDGNDIIVGGETGVGDDTLAFENAGGSSGADVLFTGDEAGTGSFFGSSGSASFTEIEVVQGTAGADRLDATATTAGTTLFGGAGDDTLIGGTGNDLLEGGEGGDTFIVLDGFSSDTIRGGNGRNTIDMNALSAAVTVTFTGDAAGTITDGTSTLTFEAIEYLILSEGADLVDATLDNLGTEIDAMGGADSVLGGGAADTVRGGEGNDTIDGAAGDDSLAGDGGDDSLSGGDGNDTLTGGAGRDTILGGNGNDSIDGGDDADSIDGGVGNDTLLGGAGNDTLLGGIGNDLIGGGEDADSLEGGDGADTLAGGAGADTLLGGTGDDSLLGGTGGDLLAGGDGADTIVQEDGFGADTITGGEGGADADLINLRALSAGATVVFSGDEAGTITDGTSAASFVETERLWLTEQADFLYASADSTGTSVAAGGGADTLTGGAGNDLLEGEDGSDSLLGGAGADTLSGGAGDDTLTGGAGNDILDGGTGADTFIVQNGFGTDTIHGGDERDTIDLSALNVPVTVTFTGDASGTITDGTSTLTFDGIEYLILTDWADLVDATADSLGIEIDALGGDDSVLGGSGADTVRAGDGNDTVDGAAGDDSLSGNLGNDSLSGGDGDDTLDGGSGLDTILGGTGTDSIDGGDGNDSIDGGAGNDTIAGGDGDDYIDGGAGDDYLTTGLGQDTLIGGEGNDTLMNSAGDDSLVGGAGDDSLVASGGNDTLEGGAGNDTLEGGVDHDSLSGGDGNDVFVYGAGDGNDTITDFNYGNTGALNDGDSTNNDFIDLSGFYDNPSQLRADQSDDGILNQSNTLDDRGNAVDYTDNTQFGTGSLTMHGATASSYSADNTGVVCFTSGTAILTPAGNVAIDDLRVGSLVCTLDNGPQRIVWIGRREVSHDELISRPELLPVLIRRGTLGAERDLLVSRQHGVLIGQDSFARSIHLAETMKGVRIARGKRTVTYIHLMFEKHQVIFSEGLAAESFFPGRMSLQMMPNPEQTEFRRLFPVFATAINTDNEAPTYPVALARPFLPRKSLAGTIPPELRPAGVSP